MLTLNMGPSQLLCSLARPGRCSITLLHWTTSLIGGIYTIVFAYQKVKVEGIGVMLFLSHMHYQKSLPVAQHFPGTIKLYIVLHNIEKELPMTSRESLIPKQVAHTRKERNIKAKHAIIDQKTIIDEETTEGNMRISLKTKAPVKKM